MKPRVTLITLAAADLDAQRRFYLDGLGWEPVLEVPGEVVFIQAGHGLLLSLWTAEGLSEDLGAPVTAGNAMALAHNVGSPDEVAEVLEAASAAGGTIVKPAGPTSWGGTQGYFADPGGFLWEVAHNPGLTFDEDGRARFG